MKTVLHFTTKLAAELHEKGYRVIPVYEKSPAKFGNNQTYPPQHNPNAWTHAIAVGVALDSVILVDFDGHKTEGAASIEEIAKTLGLTVDELNAAQVQTNEDGTSIHWWFRWHDGFDLDSIKQSNTGETLTGVDFKTKNQLSNFKPNKTNSVPHFDDLPIATPAFKKIFAKKVHASTSSNITVNSFYTNQTTRYGQRALDNILDELSSVTENRNVALNKAAFQIGRLISGGEIAEFDALNNLENVAFQLLPDEPSSVRPTIQSGIEAGKKDPFNKKTEDRLVKELTSEINSHREVLRSSKEKINAAKLDLDSVKAEKKEASALIKELKAKAKVGLDTDDEVEAQEYALDIQAQILEATKKLDGIKADELEKAKIFTEAKQLQNNAKIAASDAASRRALIRKIFSESSADSEIVDYIVETGLVENIARDEDGTCFFYDGFKWSHLGEIDYRGYFSKKIIPEIMEGGYNNHKLNAIAKFCLSYLGQVPKHQAGLVGFSNGVLDVNTMELIPHDQNFGLSSCNSFPYDPSDTFCPNFAKWLIESTAGETEEISKSRMEVVMAALYMIMTNRFDWQKYIEVVGEGGTGKSIFVKICEMLTANPVSTTMDMIECTKSAHGLEPLIGASLIVVPDARQYIGDMNNVKAITGNDSISINPKNRKMITLSPVPAVLVITANQPMIITDKSTGVWRRRVVIYFDNVVKDRDYELHAKLLSEKVAIFNTVAEFFQSPEEAKNVLDNAINNADKLRAVVETDPMYSWISECIKPGEETRIGGRQGWIKAKSLRGKAQITAMKNEAQTRLYSSYLLYCEDHSIAHPLSQRVFTTKLITSLKTLGFENVFHKKPKNISIITGITISPDSQSLLHLDDIIEQFHSYQDEPIY